jgi:hypothetical protein
VLGFVWPWAWLVPGGYFLLTTAGGLALRADLTLRERMLLPVVLPTMHLAWGWGFLTSRVRLNAAAA